MPNTSNHMLHNIYIYKKNPLDFLEVCIFSERERELSLYQKLNLITYWNNFKRNKVVF